MNERLGIALRALRESGAGLGAPADLETKLRAAYRAHHGHTIRNTRKRYYPWVAGAIAASLAGIAVWRFALEQPSAKSEAPVRTATRGLEVAPTTEVKSEPPLPQTRRPARKQIRAGALAGSPQLVVPSPHGQRREVTTDFIPLPYAPAFTTHDRGQVVRVKLPRSSMRTIGLPVNEERLLERVEADVVLGEDGIARAIRFVQ